MASASIAGISGKKNEVKGFIADRQPLSVPEAFSLRP
jgi:hypothetical protein